MADNVRNERFAPGFEGQREVAAFWIVGSLKALEARARRESDPDGRRPSLIEIALAVAIAIAATALVATLL